MKATMTRAARAELANAIRTRYSTVAGKEKRRTLEEFIAATGYHEKSAAAQKGRQTRNRPSLYDEAARGALIVLWEASDRVCGKRLKALLPILLPALERNGHLKLEEAIRPKILSMSAATIDRLLRMPRNATRTKKAPRIMPEPRRRIKMRTFADRNEPPVVRKNCVTYQRSRGSIRDAARPGSDGHGRQTILRSDGSNLDVDGQDGSGAFRGIG